MLCPIPPGALDGKLYAVGGECETKFAHEGTLYLASVEFYDPIHNEWTSVREMKHPRSFTAVAVLGSECCVWGQQCLVVARMSVV